MDNDPPPPDRHHDDFQGRDAAALMQLARKEKFFHNMRLPGIDTGTWVYGDDLPPNYHLFPIFQLFNELNVEGMTCLDIGTYDGMTAFSLAARGALRVDATCQYDLPRFRLARALGAFRTVAYFPQTDLDRIHATFAAESYDLVVMSAMLHHLLSPLEGLMEARRLLKTDGMLVLEVVVREGPTASVDLNTELGDPIYGVPTIWIPSPGAVLGMLRFAGFEPVTQLQLLGGKVAREPNYERLTVLARARPLDEITGRTPKLQETHRQRPRVGRYALADFARPSAQPSLIRHTGPGGERWLNCWEEAPVDPLQPSWTNPRPERGSFCRIASNADFSRLAAKLADGAFNHSDLRFLSARYPGQTLPEGMCWGLKQLGNLHALEHVRDWGLVDVLEIGPGFNLYFPNHLPRQCRYTGLDDAGFYGAGLLSGADAERLRGRRAEGLLGRSGHGLAAASFDACISVSVLEHVAAAEIDAVCEDMHRLLRPGGWALHSIDAPQSQVAQRGMAWLQALRRAGFAVDPATVALDPASTAQPFVEPLSIVMSFYGGYRESVWGDRSLKASEQQMTVLVAARKRQVEAGPATPR